MSRLAADLQSAGLRDPVLIVAGAAEVTRLAPAWADSLAAIGWTHRVLVSEGGPGGDEIAVIVAEAISLAAAAIVAVGNAGVVSAAEAAAAAAHLPLVARRVAGTGGEPATL